MSDSNLSRLMYVPEATFGTTPASALQILRTTGWSFTPTQNTITSAEIRADLRAGRPVRTSQMASGTINQEWSYSTFDGILAGLLMEDWASDVLVDGTTKKAFTFVDQPTDIASLYRVFRGSRIASASMSLALDSIISGAFGVMTAVPSTETSQPGDGTTAATTTGPLNTVDMVETLTEGATGGTPAALARVIGIDLNLTRELREKREIGNINPWDIGVGNLMVEGNIQLHFTSAAQLTAWENFSDRSLTINLQDEDDNEILVEIPKFKYIGDADVSQPGVNDDRILTLNWQAYAEADDAALIRFTRTAG
jgi:hypothetical protein